MSKRMVQLFWSYDIEKTEKWLNRMAEKGYQLSAISLLTRKFTFEKSEAKQRIYRIIFAKDFETNFSVAMQEAGWEHVCSQRNWHIISHEETEKDIQVFPDREGIINHNRTIQYIFAGLLLYLTLPVMTGILLVFATTFGNMGVAIVPSPYWSITIAGGLLSLLTIGIAFYSVFKIPATNDRLMGSITKVNDMDKSIHGGQLIKRRRWYWFDAPDRLENWLEDMEKRGYQLQKVSANGWVFSFVKSVPQSVKYIVDFQYSAKKSYFDMHKEAGWKLFYTSSGTLFKWSIWSQSFEEGERQPEIYTDRSSRIKHAGKVLFINSVFSLPFLALIYFIFSMNGYYYLGMSFFRWVSLVIYLAGTVVFLARILRSVLYFFRVRKKA